MEFSHKWANQVLKARGFPSPDLGSLQSIIAGANESDHLQMYEVLERLERGTERNGDSEWLSIVLKRPPPDLVPTAGPQSVEHRPVNKSLYRVDPLIAVEHDAARKEARVAAKALRPKHHIYGLKGALTVEMDALRVKGDDGLVLQTVILEAASAAGHRSYDWANKIGFQFMRRELPLLACALLGMLDKPLEMGNHGQEANKFVVITDQGDKLFVQVKQGARLFAVPVGPSDVHAWVELVMQALAANAPAMGEAIQLAALGRIAAMENKRFDKSKKGAA